MEEKIKSLEEENGILLDQYKQHSHILNEYSKTISELNQNKKDLSDKLASLELKTDINTNERNIKERNIEEGIRLYTKEAKE